MPKQTYFNLPKLKRNAIEKEAMEEFSQRPYEQASLSKIVEKCGIAKGSMYQYFADKLDLYLYIVDLAYKQKRTYVADAFATKGDIFAILEAYYRASFYFSQQHPLLHRVTLNFWESKDQILADATKTGRSVRASDFEQYLSKAIKSGVVSSKLNPEAIFFVYHAVGRGMIDQFGEDFNENFLTEILDVIKYGLQIRKEDENV